MPAAATAADTMWVLPQPGGPYNSTPVRSRRGALQSHICTDAVKPHLQFKKTCSVTISETPHRFKPTVKLLCDLDDVFYNALCECLHLHKTEVVNLQKRCCKHDCAVHCVHEWHKDC